MKITVITGNKSKIAEWQRLMPLGYEIDNVDVDLVEIQSTDPLEIINHKALEAYKLIQKPLIVEDVSAGLDELNGLPGPFIKQFIKSLGEDALHILAKSDSAPAKVACVIAYYDGKTLKTVIGEVKGHVVPKRGDNGFGFDKVFMPDGQHKTYGEMTSEEKDLVSHRSKAIGLLLEYLKTSSK